jgi:hypothetical protein
MGVVRCPVECPGCKSKITPRLGVGVEHKQGESPITLVDEIERGLEPYRQRSLMFLARRQILPSKTVAGASP